VAVIAALVGAAAGAGVAALVASSWSKSKTTIIRQAVQPSPPIAKLQSIPQILAKVEPGVVSIHATVPGGSSSGTGIILAPDGQVLTNYHVVRGSISIAVTMFNQTSGRPATLRGYDQSNDVALLQITGASGLPAVELGESASLAVGDDVVAVGNALNLAGGPTVTQGIVSAKGRTIDPTEPPNLIQTDAAINPGNSGGPLVNGAGKVVGINTLVIPRSNSQEYAQNLGFAIPIDTIKPLLPELVAGKAIVPGYMGVGVVTLTPQIAQQFGIAATQGAIIQDLPTDGPAALAGLQQFDVITSIGGQKVTSDADLVRIVHTHKPGEQVTVTFIRGRTSGSATVTLGQAPTSSP
jgi:S1-C subfamily serine protease